MKNWLIIIILVIFGVAAYFALSKTDGPVLRQAFTTERIKFKYDEEYNLALSLSQVVAKSLIPPCGERFDYCVYYNGDEYKGSNLDSVGIAINERLDASDKEACLNTPPGGSDLKPRGVLEGMNYSTSAIGPKVESGGGYSISEDIYRVFTTNTCYEIKTRIAKADYITGQGQFKKEFSTSDEDTMVTAMQNMIKKTELVDTGEVILFPGLENN